MARIIYNAVVSSINGSVSGTTFQKNAFGFTIRKKPQPVNPKSVLQSNRRTVFADITKTWNLLTDAQRALWNSVLTNYPTYARYAPSVIINGRMLFIKYNAIRMAAGYDMLIDFTISTPAIYQQNLGLINENGKLQAVWGTEFESKDIGVALQLSSNQGSQPWKKPTVYRNMVLSKIDSTHYDVSDSYITHYGALAVTNDWVGVKSCMFSLTQPYFYAYLENVVQVGGIPQERSTFDLTAITTPSGLTGTVNCCYNFNDKIAIVSGGNNEAYVYTISTNSFSAAIPAPRGLTYASIGINEDGVIQAAFVEDRSLYEWVSSTSEWVVIWDPGIFTVWGRCILLRNNTMIFYSSIQSKCVYSTDGGSTWNYFTFQSTESMDINYWGPGLSSKLLFVASDGNCYIGNTEDNTWDNIGKPYGDGNVQSIYGNMDGDIICCMYPSNSLYSYSSASNSWSLLKDLELSGRCWNLSTSENSLGTAVDATFGKLQADDSNENLTELTDLTPANTPYEFIYNTGTDDYIIISNVDLKLIKATLILA